MYLFNCLFITVFNYLFIYLFIYVCIYLFMYLFIYFCVYLFIYLCIIGIRAVPREFHVMFLEPDTLYRLMTVMRFKSGSGAGHRTWGHGRWEWELGNGWVAWNSRCVICAGHTQITSIPIHILEMREHAPCILGPKCVFGG